MFRAFAINGQISGNIKHPGIQAAFAAIVAGEAAPDFEKGLLDDILRFFHIVQDRVYHAKKGLGIVVVQVGERFLIALPDQNDQLVLGICLFR